MKKKVKFAIAAAWIGAMLTACVPGAVPGAVPEAIHTNDPAVSAGKLPFDPPVTITTAKALRDNDKLQFGDTPANNPITRWAKEKLGIIQTYKWIVTDQNDALVNKIRLALASREELPDVLFLTQHEIPELLPELAASGQIMSVEQAFEQYAPKRVKEAYARNPEVWRTVTLEGKRWGLPHISEATLGDPILWIRQDWLDRLKLKAPATLDELELVLDAFTNDDPDGNGLRDTVGIAVAGSNTLNGWMGDVSFLFGAYGEQPYQWNRSSDGSLAYGSIQPEVGQALDKLRDWYDRGYVDPDFGTRDEQQAAELFVSGGAGVISGPGWMGGWPLSEANLPEGAIRPIPYPDGPDGKMSRVGTRQSYGSYFFRQGFDRMDAVFAYWDAVYGVYLEDPDSDFRHGFGEGYDYIIENGQAQYDFPGVNSTVSNYLLFAPGSPADVLPEGSLESRVFQGYRRTPYEQKLAATSSRLYLEGRLIAEQQQELSRSEQFDGPQTDTMRQKWPLLQKLEKETFLKVAYGKASPEAALREFRERWLAYGGDQITKEVNDWDRMVSGAPAGLGSGAADAGELAADAIENANEASE